VTALPADHLDFENIHEAFRLKIHRYLTRLIGEAEAEDLTQEVFVKVSRALQDFRGESQLSTWIYRIATNAAVDRMRNPSFHQAAALDLSDDANEITGKELWTGEEPPSLEQQLLHKERYECFIEYVKNLPLKYRAILVLAELEGMTNSEIAEILGLSLETVKIRLHRGRVRLLQELKEHCKAEDWL
jgi:RNA polymerase sigma-70 factor (ECF subfamily)